MGLIGRKPFLTRYRFESSQKEVRYQSRKIEDLLEWTPPIGVDEAIESILGQHKTP